MPNENSARTLSMRLGQQAKPKEVRISPELDDLLVADQNGELETETELEMELQIELQIQPEVMSL